VICFSDNDIILKLAACDLLEEMLAVLGMTRARTRVLPTAPSYFEKNPRLRVKHTPEQLQRASDFVNSVDKIDRNIDPQEQRVLSRVEGIDSGEVILFGATKFYPYFVVATGDKKSLRAIAADDDCAAIHRRLKGSVVCFEQVITKIITVKGYDTSKLKLVPALNCDPVLAAAFSAGLGTPESFVTTFLSNKVATLRLETAQLLIA
jgi:hypothetical protein